MHSLVSLLLSRRYFQFNVHGIHCIAYTGAGSVVDLFFIVAPIVCGGFVFGPCFVMRYLQLKLFLSEVIAKLERTLIVSSARSPR